MQPIFNSSPPAPFSLRAPVSRLADYLLGSGENRPYVLIICIFLFAGLVGHDPWKADEAYVFGMIHHLLDTGDWVVPMVGGEPFVEKPPLYYIVAAIFAKCLSGIFPAHDAARLASGFFMGVACLAVSSAVRLWWGPGRGRYAALVLVASLGALVHAHAMMPDVPLLCGFALASWGFAYILRRPVKGGVILGIGAGVGFMSKGILAPAVLGAVAIALPLLFREWRTRAYAKGLAFAAAAALPWLLIWPIALYLRSRELFVEWFWMNNVGRFLGFSVPMLGARHFPWLWPQTIPWFTFPALPLAMYGLWRERAKALREPAIQYSLVFFSIFMTMLAVSSSGRGVYGLPLIVPLAIAASAAVTALPDWVNRFAMAVSVIAFGILSAVLWYGWGVMMATGLPPAWPFLARFLPDNFLPAFSPAAFTAAVLFTAGCGYFTVCLRKSPVRGLAAWVAGITLVWSLAMTLWLPWIDFSKTYRDVFHAMPLPSRMRCLSTIGLGEGERAMLRYFTGHFPVRLEIHPQADCDVLLVQGYLNTGIDHLDLSGWRQTWAGARPGDTNQKFWLYVADPLAEDGWWDSASSSEMLSLW